jgi:uncharacterized phage-associated protein
MLLSTKSIANYFIELAQAKGETLSPMKLQKLVYYAVGWYAGHTGRPLADEAVEAWQYGPVFPSLYHEFKKYGSSPITAKANEYGDGDELHEVAVPADPHIRKFLENIWASYGKFTGIALSEMTHAPGSPWDLTRQAANGVRNADIPFDAILKHFKIVAENAKARLAAA